jgi:negative regulator of flagellin synthesis FlgM
MRVGNSGTNAQGAEAKHSGRPADAKEAKENKEIRETKEAKRAEKIATAEVEKKPPPHGAHTEISAKSKEFAQAKGIATDAPDMRDEKIAELKKRISEGSYNVNPDAVSDRLVDEHLKMSGIG